MIDDFSFRRESLRSRSSIKSIDRYDGNRQSRKQLLPRSKNNNKGKKTTLNKNISHGLNKIHKAPIKNARHNAFACGKNNQNNKTLKNNRKKSNDVKIDHLNEEEEYDWAVNDEIKEKSVPKKARKAIQKTAACWAYFVQKEGLTKNNKPCLINFCNIKEGDKTCGQKFIAHSGTSHMNEHLYVDHKKEEFRPKRLYGTPAVREINELMAKFIVSANLAFNIVENKYLVVSSCSIS